MLAGKMGSGVHIYLQFVHGFLQKDIDAVKKATEALTHATTGLLYEEDKTKDLSKFLLDKFYEDRKKAS